MKIFTHSNFLTFFVSFLTLISVYSIQAFDGELNSDTKSQDELDAYDPFTDFNEFENTEKEQKDILFFQQGRFFTFGVQGGWRLFIGDVASLVYPYYVFGVFMGYFVNLNISINASFLSSFHRYVVIYKKITEESILDYQTFALDVKFYFNKDKLIKVLSFFNPHIIVGPFIVRRSATKHFQRDQNIQSEGELGIGGKIGVGIKIELGNGVYIGSQSDFFFQRFETDNEAVRVEGENTKYFLNGNIINGSAILGIDF